MRISRSPSRPFTGLASIAGLLGVGMLGVGLLGVGMLGCAPSGDAQPTSPAASEQRRAAAAPSAVTALGRLEPGLGTIDVGTPVGERVQAVLVAEGQSVDAGQALVRLERFDTAAAEVALRRAARDEAAQALLRAETLAPLAVRAWRAEVRRLEADLGLAESDLARTRALVDEAVLPDRDLDHGESVAEQARARLDHGRSVLRQETRARELDIRQAEVRLAHAEAAVVVAEVAHRQAEIRSPVAGTVLDLRILPGEPTDGGPILVLGETGRMVAVAEVYETDARFVRTGQRARITSPALPTALEGTVEHMGALVRRNDVLSLDPAADRDARVIEARIRLDDPRLAARFVHLQVDVRIETADRAPATPAGGA